LKILGISASHRQWENTDTLIHHVLQGAAREGIETRFLRFTDFVFVNTRMSILPFKKSGCGIDDQFAGLYEIFRRIGGWPKFSTLSLNEGIPLDKVNFF
jgi:multimeric flavodoxin WrbA